jgi:hypothetical protein
MKELNWHISERTDEYLWQENNWTEMTTKERRKREERNMRITGIESDRYFGMLKETSGA